MNTKIILSFGVTTLLTTSLFAYSNMQGQHHNMMNKQYTQGCYKNMNQNKMNSKMMKMFMMLNLSEKQKEQIQEIVKKSQKNIPNPHKAFTQTSFDKVTFVKLAKEKKYGDIERQANLLEKIYKVLSSSQKKDFKTIMDMQELRKKRMMTK